MIERRPKTPSFEGTSEAGETGLLSTLTVMLEAEVPPL
jgi:hypothetical protein